MRPSGPSNPDSPGVVVVRAVLPAPPAQVFELFSTAAGLEAWFCDGARADPGPGGAVEARWRDDGDGERSRCGAFVEWQPPHLVSVAWSGDGELWRVAIADHPQGSMVAVLSPPLPADGGARAQVRHDTARMGWEVALAALAELIGQGPPAA